MIETVIDVLCFFFQAEDGIRDLTVTGVQTCALPIFQRSRGHGRRWISGERKGGQGGWHRAGITVRVLSHPDLEYLDAIRLQGEGAPWHALEVDDHSHPLAGREQQRAARLRVRQIALLARDLSEIDRCRAEMQGQVAVETTVHDSKQVLARLDAEVRPRLAA